MDKCKTENGKCSHYCSYDYISLDFVCSCPPELTISENMKDCKRIDDTHAMDDVMITKSDDENIDEKPFDYFSENEHSSVPTPNSEPEPSSEPDSKSEPEPNSDSEPKSEPEPSSEPKSKSEPEPSSEPESKSEPEPSPEPESKSEPEPSSEPEVKAEPVPNSETEVQAEHEANSETAFNPIPVKTEQESISEPVPSSEPASKVEPEPSSEPAPKTETEPISEPGPKVEPEPVSKTEPEPSSDLTSKLEPEPSSEPASKAEPEPSSEPASKAEPVPSSEPTSKDPFEHISEPTTKEEPEPSSEPASKVEPESTSEPATKAEPEPSSEPEVKPSLESHRPEPEPSSEPNSKSSTMEMYESLSDVDISSEFDTSDQNNKAPVDTSSEKSILNIDQTDREAKSHSEEVFNHEIKPEITYTVSTESEFETKTEVSVKDSKPKESNEFALVDVDLNVPEQSSTLPSITENWLITTQSSNIQGVPKLPSDLEVTDKENGDVEKEMEIENATSLNPEQTEFKSESSTIMGIVQTELKSENKSVDPISESNIKMSSEFTTTLPGQSTFDNFKDVPSMVTEATIDASSSSIEDMSSSTKGLDNISVEHVTEFMDITTMLSIIEQMPIKKQEEPQNSEDLIKLSGKKHSDDLSSLDKINIPDPTKKLQSLTSLEEQIINLPFTDVTSSTPSNIDNLNENVSIDQHESLDQIRTSVGEQNIADIVGEDEKTSVLDLYQKPELKKKEKKTSKNPDLYVTDTGYKKE